MNSLPLALLAVSAGGFTMLVRWHRHKYQQSPIRLFRSGRLGQTITEIRVVILGVLVLWQGLASAFGLYFPVITPLFSPMPMSGTVIFLFGISLVAAAIVTMGASWQMGFDQSRPPHFVTEGIFRYSRNPIYLGIAIAMFAWFLLIPTLLWMIAALGVAVGVRYQAVQEEKFLQATFGAQFREWARSTGRFVPMVGRLS